MDKISDLFIFGCFFVLALVLGVGFNYLSNFCLDRTTAAVTDVFTTPTQRIVGSTFEMIPPYTTTENPPFVTIKFSDEHTVQLVLNDVARTAFSARTNMASDHSVSFTDPQSSQVYYINISNAEASNGNNNQIEVVDASQNIVQTMSEVTTKSSDDSFTIVPFVPVITSR